MAKVISMKTINKIKDLRFKIYEQEDDSQPNYHTIARCNRWIIKYLKDYSLDEYYELLQNIDWYKDNCSENLKKLGWIINN